LVAQFTYNHLPNIYRSTFIISEIFLLSDKLGVRFPDVSVCFYWT